MTEEQFWELVSRDYPEQDQQQLQARLTEKLQGLSDDELAEFDKHFARQLRLSYSWDLWGAAYIIAGVDSDYGFAEFRNFLVTLGKERYQAACNAADSLGELKVWPQLNGYAYPFVEEIDLLAGQLYETRTGKELPFVPSGLSQPKGKRFNDQPKALRKLYPKLSARFPF
ncbi:DUF4240 domain-containing protein [Shewanella algae]|uniref:DUF4240 domain-containing protein n=1 Tax=Shewanella algae TaxID=38313 RepID=UPI001AADF590|nr:DUF4240 domain-containing protein [Shewanella algae]MBO2673584.1 DUF4240 domain-containing protein [Shewanella algae]